MKPLMRLLDAGVREREWGQKMFDEVLDSLGVSEDFFWEHAVYDSHTDEIRLNVTLAWEVRRP